jgi:hypothetical protein
MNINLNHNAKFYAIALKIHQKAQAKMIEVGSDTDIEGLDKVLDDMILAGAAMNNDLRELKRKMGR